MARRPASPGSVPCLWPLEMRWVGCGACAPRVCVEPQPPVRCLWPPKLQLAGEVGGLTTQREQLERQNAALSRAKEQVETHARNQVSAHWRRTVSAGLLPVAPPGALQAQTARWSSRAAEALWSGSQAACFALCALLARARRCRRSRWSGRRWRAAPPASAVCAAVAAGYGVRWPGRAELIATHKAALGLLSRFAELNGELTSQLEAAQRSLQALTATRAMAAEAELQARAQEQVRQVFGGVLRSRPALW